MGDLVLDPKAIAETIERLRARIDRRFPDSGLGRVARELERVAHQARERSAWIGRPLVAVRVSVAALLLLLTAGLARTAISLRTPDQSMEVFQFIQLLESGINDVVLLGAGVFFLLTLETRIKRGRALSAIRELRAIAHIIDMHQLTKDPEWAGGQGRGTSLVARPDLSRFELSRYLDYCTEMLSITGKIAALYIQNFDDDVALAAVNEVENLTSGLSRTVWQKLMIVYQMGPEGEARPAASPLNAASIDSAAGPAAD
jgi:hypothetical protein